MLCTKIVFHNALNCIELKGLFKMIKYLIAVDKATDYQGRSWLEVPRSETQLRSDTPPAKCFLPKV